MIFNQTMDSHAVREKMYDAMGALLEHRRTVPYQPAGDSRYIVVKKSRSGKEIITTTRLYDIPANH